MDVRTTVKDVMLIQKHKAQMMDVELSCQFQGFEHEEDYKICTDE